MGFRINMFTTTEESAFFFAEIDQNKKVLEYGSGQSTIEISGKCRSVVSVEHQEYWHNKTLQIIPSNCELMLKKPTLHYVEGGHCGTYEEFEDYVEAPLPKGPFDIILIDGRARVACASICKRLGHKDTIVFMHDFERPEYQEALTYLEQVAIVGRMAKFKIKENT
jgi:hypothetical protein